MSATEDPYPRLHELRSKGAVVHGDVRDLLGTSRMAQFADVDCYTALSYEACREVLTDATRFSSRAYAPQHDKKMGGATILSMDDPEHGPLRALVSHGFRPRSMEVWAETVIPAVFESLVDDLAASGSPADLVPKLTFPYPVQVIAAILGVNAEDWPNFLRWTIALVGAGDDPARAMAAGSEVQTYIAGEVARKRAEPSEDVVSLLAEASIEGATLDDAEIVAFLSLLLTAGGETTVRGLGSTLVGLLTNPEQWQYLLEHPEEVGRAVDEGLRWNTPVTGVRRLVVEDTEVAGVELPAGSHVVTHLGAANRDPARWTNPDAFDVHREPLPGLSFGFGPHYCLGVHLAKTEIRIALEQLVRRVEGLRLDPTQPSPTIVGLELRGPTALPALFDAIQPATAGVARQ